MALDSTYWSTGWEGVRIDQDWSSAVTIQSVTSPYRSVFITLYENVVQAAATDDEEMNSNQYGRFYLAYGTDTHPIRWVQVFGEDPNPQPRISLDHKTLRRLFSFVCKPSTTAYSLAEGFIIVSADNYVSSGGVNWTLRHFQPKTYRGNAARVISAIMLDVGADAGWLDADAFSDADDGQAAMTTEPDLIVLREIGETIADTIKRAARHSNDILAVNMAGKLSLVSRSSPPAGPSSLTVSDTLGRNEWHYGWEYLANVAYSVIGDFYLGNSVYNYAYPPISSNDEPPLLVRTPFTDAYRDYRGVWSVASSISRYGSRVLSNGEGERVINGQAVKTPIYHFPHFIDDDCRDAVMERMSKDGQLRKVVTVRQDLRGLDYDIGYEVTNIAVTGDGATISAATCIEKTIDFQNLTVTSTLLEEV